VPKMANSLFIYFCQICSGVEIKIIYNFALYLNNEAILLESSIQIFGNFKK
jgi:hypothetical protein